jgi:hypothetical protein
MKQYHNRLRWVDARQVFDLPFGVLIGSVYDRDSGRAGDPNELKLQDFKMDNYPKITGRYNGWQQQVIRVY